MTANYSLTLVNPAATTHPPSVLYTGVDGGNTLNLIVGNNFGFDMQIGGSSLGQSLVVQISSNIMDADGAALVKAAAPWTVQSFAAPGTFNLRPPAGGLTLPDGGTITITLQDVHPSAATTGLVSVRYQFDDTPADDLNASANVSTMAPPDVHQPPLIGDNDALRLTTYVNGGSSSNPIMVSAAPVTGATAVDNQLHFNLLFQQATSSLTSPASGGSGLVSQWDPAHPPSIRVFFPYFTAGQLPAPLDLTDALQKGDANYDELTSAWNIRGSLDADGNVTSDTFWRIGIDPLASVPVWLITPTPANTSLFTVVESSTSEPGPFLNFYLLGIVSALPIDERNPDTILYVQWNGFPGFNDGIVAYPLQKTMLAIGRFDVKVRRGPDGPELVAYWSTTGALSCRLSGDAEQLETSTDATGYTRAITPDQPMLSSYTLAAISADGVTQVARTRVVRWSFTSALSGPPIDGASAPTLTADGRTVIVLGGPDSSHNGMIFCDAETLQPRSLTPTLAGGNSIFALTATPDGTVLFAMSVDSNAVYGFAWPGLQPTPGSGAAFATGFQGVALLAVSADSTTVVQVDFATDNSGQMVILSASTLQPLPASPVSLAQGGTGIAVGTQTGRYYISTPGGAVVLDPQTYRSVLAVPVLNASDVAVPASETDMYLSTFDPNTHATTIVRVDAASGAVTVQLNTTVAVLPPPMPSGFVAAPDGAALFLCGFDLNATRPEHAVTVLKGYDGTTLEELPWSPVSFGGLYPLAIALSPDGSRLFAMVIEAIDDSTSTTLVAVDPEFT